MRIHLNNRERQYLLQKTTYVISGANNISTHVISGRNKHTSCIDPNEQGQIDWLAERYVPPEYVQSGMSATSPPSSL